jgi:hypothetical protein
MAAGQTEAIAFDERGAPHTTIAANANNTVVRIRFEPGMKVKWMIGSFAQLSSEIIRD